MDSGEENFLAQNREPIFLADQAGAERGALVEMGISYADRRQGLSRRSVAQQGYDNTRSLDLR